MKTQEIERQKLEIQTQKKENFQKFLQSNFDSPEKAQQKSRANLLRSIGSLIFDGKVKEGVKPKPKITRLKKLNSINTLSNIQGNGNASPSRKKKTDAKLQRVGSQLFQLQKPKVFCKFDQIRKYSLSETKNNFWEKALQKNKAESRFLNSYMNDAKTEKQKELKQKFLKRQKIQKINFANTTIKKTETIGEMDGIEVIEKASSKLKKYTLRQLREQLEKQKKTKSFYSAQKESIPTFRNINDAINYANQRRSSQLFSSNQNIATSSLKDRNLQGQDLELKKQQKINQLIKEKFCLGLKATVIHKQIDGLRPDCREGSSLLQVRSHKNFKLRLSFYLIGGIGSSVVTSISVLGNEADGWEKREMDIFDSTQSIKYSFGLYFHTADIFKNKLIVIYGGYREDVRTFSSRVMNPDIFYFEPSTCTMICVPVQMSFKPPSRRNHASCIIGDQLFVVGGYDEFDRYLHDIWGFKIGKKKLLKNFR